MDVAPATVEHAKGVLIRFQLTIKSAHYSTALLTSQKRRSLDILGYYLRKNNPTAVLVGLEQLPNMKNSGSPGCRVSDEMTVLALNNLWGMKTSLANIHILLV